mgnify:CR=1 FL=1
MSAKVYEVIVRRFLSIFYRGGQHPGVRTGIGHHLFFIQLLHDPQSFVGTDLEQFGTIVLQLCQIVQKGRILILIFTGGLQGTFWPRAAIKT